MCVYNIGATLTIRANNLLTSTYNLSNIHAKNHKAVVDISFFGSISKHKSYIYICPDVRETVYTNT